MGVFAIAGVAMIAAVLSLMLKKYSPEFALFVSITSGLFILATILAKSVPVFEHLWALLEKTGASREYVKILLKALGVCFLVQFTADSCNDAGQSALANKVELAGKVAVVVLALPLFEEILKVVGNLVGA